jgi:hypothetical protein
VELVITKTLEEHGPGQDTHWSTRPMAVATGMSHSAISPALDQTAPILPVARGTPARIAHDYVRLGTTSLFAATDSASASVIAHHYRRHHHQELLRFLKLIDAAVPMGWGCT